MSEERDRLHRDHGASRRGSSRHGANGDARRRGRRAPPGSGVGSSTWFTEHSALSAGARGSLHRVDRHRTALVLRLRRRHSPLPIPGCGGPTRCGRRSARRRSSTRMPEIPLVLLTTAAPVAAAPGTGPAALARRGGTGGETGAVLDVVELGQPRTRPACVATRRRASSPRRRHPQGPAPRESGAALLVPDDRTTVTELATALGTLGLGDLPTTLAQRPEQLDITPSTWEQLEALHASGRFDAEFATAFANGEAFLEAPDALAGADVRDWSMDRRAQASRGRGGTGRPPDRPRVPRQLQVPVPQHRQPVAGPALRRAAGHLRGVGADRLVRGGCARRVRAPCTTPAGPPRGSTELPDDLGRSETDDRQRLRRALPGRSYPRGGPRPTGTCARRVSTASAERGRPTCRAGAAEKMLWRLLRIGNAATSCWGPTRAGRCACGWRAPGTGARRTIPRPRHRPGRAGTAPGELVGHLRRAAGMRPRRSRATSRCAGATAASPSRPRPRSTSTLRPTRSRATSPSSAGPANPIVGLRRRPSQASTCRRPRGPDRG